MVVNGLPSILLIFWSEVAWAIYGIPVLINSPEKVLSSKPAIIHTIQITLKEVKDALLSDDQGLEFLYAQNLGS